MKKRLPTGMAILAVTILFIVLKQVQDLFFDLFAIGITYASLFEVVKAKNKDRKFDNFAVFFVPVIAFFVLYFVDLSNFFLLLMLIAVLFLCFSMLVEIVEYGLKRKHNETEQNTEVLNQNLFRRTKENMSFLAYPVLPLLFLIALNHLPYKVAYIGIILTFVIAMSTDTMAYCAGRLFGKRKFIPEVSPNKTIAGVVGGFVGATVGVLISVIIFKNTGFADVINIIGTKKLVCVFGLMAIVGSLATQMGDLIASAYKRKIGIKDFSNVFPGHGGFMDRVDGLMFVSVVCYAMLALFVV